MSPRAKHLPRLWCALQGLLPLGPASWPRRNHAATTPPAGANGARLERRAKKPARRPS